MSADDAQNGAEMAVDRIREIEGLVITDGFDRFVRTFGRSTDGERYVSVNSTGTYSGDTGAVLGIVLSNGTRQDPQMQTLPQ